MLYSPRCATRLLTGKAAFTFCRLLLGLLLFSKTLTAAGLPSPQPAASDPDGGTFVERINLLDLSADVRFNYMDRQDGTVTDQGMQYRLRARVRLDLRRDGNTYFTVRSETGKGFDNSWNNSGAGLGNAQGVFNVKAISLHQNIGSMFQAEAGGLEFERGAATDATSASGDGHMTGYRAMLTGPGIHPRKIALTAGYVGDFDKPNFFSRARMDSVNYLQLVAEEDLHERIRASAEVNSIHKVLFSRAAVRTGRLWIFDNTGLEAVVRSMEGFRFGWSSRLGRDWGRSIPAHTDLIYSDLPTRLYVVDNQRVLFNRGEFDIGKRLALETGYHLTRDCEIGVFAGRLLDSSPSKRWIAQAGIRYQFAGLANLLLH